MKKYFIIALAVFALVFATGVESSARFRYGAIGGINFSSAKTKEWNRGTMTAWHAGLTCRVDLPLGFSLQPSLIYNVKGMNVGVPEDISGSNFDLSMGYVELPVSVQWGPDLLLFRPFLDVTPYIGYAVSQKMTFTDANVNYKNWDGLQRFEYGLGLGIGLDIWRFQVIGRYNWNFGRLFNADGKVDGLDSWGAFADKFSDGNFGGVTLSVAFLFGGGNKSKK